MKNDNQVILRNVIPSDLPIFYEHQLDKGAVEMVGLPSRDHDAFTAHWKKIMAEETIILRTIVYDDQVAGYLTTFIRNDIREVGYWLGREFWARGIATQALRLFLPLIPYRPLFGITTHQNLASQKVLMNCGFALVGESEGLLKFQLLTKD